MNQLDRYTCEQAFERLDDYIDRELGPEETKLLEDHLEICAWCAKVYKYQRATIEQLKGRLRRVSAPPDLMSKLTGVLDRVDAE